jgi:large subunit ribosomal protein L13
MKTTVRLKASQIYKDWHVIDAAGRPLGRVASEAAVLLRGKHKPTFEKHLDGGDFVIIVNASKVKVSGRKESQIKYYTHSGYPGGLRTRTYVEQMARFPDRVVAQAVWGMLPDGPLGKKILRHLKVYAGPDHPHASQIAHTAAMQKSRSEAEAASVTAERRAPRLRPLSVPEEGREVSSDRTATPGPKAAKTRPAPAAQTRRGKAPRVAAATTVAIEAEASTDTVLTAEAPVAAAAAVNEDVLIAEQATPAEAAVSQGEGLTVEKPKRTRKVTAKTEGAAEEAPKPRARRTKATEAAAEVASDEPKPARRRAAKQKSEE